MSSLSCRAFHPTCEELGRIDLLSIYSIGSFLQPIVQDAADTTNHTAWAVPGMQYTVQSVLPGGGTYTGIKQVTYTLPPGMDCDPTVTWYTTTTAQYGLTGPGSPKPQIVHVYGSPSSQTFDRVNLACPKDVNTYTITITEQAWRYDTPGKYDTIIDKLKVRVEAPTINSFQVADQSAASTPASGFWFGRVSYPGGKPTPDPQGPDYRFMLTDGTLPEQWVGMWADIKNNTHYNLGINYVQTVSFSELATFDDGSGRSAAGTTNIDMTKDAQTYYYNDYTRFYRKGESGSMPTSNQVDGPQDSPFLDRVLSSNGVAVVSMDFAADFLTHLVVSACQVPATLATATCFPVALSTAEWHLDGTASGLNTLNWTSDCAAGRGPSPASLPAANAKWIAPGDGVPKYLSWLGNSLNDLGTFARDSALASRLDFSPDTSSPGVRAASLGLMPPPSSPAANPPLPAVIEEPVTPKATKTRPPGRSTFVGPRVRRPFDEYRG